MKIKFMDRNSYKIIDGDFFIGENGAVYELYIDDYGHFPSYEMLIRSDLIAIIEA